MVKQRMNTARLAYYCLCAISLVLMVVALVVVPKPDLHLWLVGEHTSLADTFWRYYTLLAEWPLYLFMLLPLCGMFRLDKSGRKQRVWSVLAFGIAEGASAALVQLLKWCWNMPRPVTFFENLYGSSAILPLVDGVVMREWHSFPSGHTATFFVFFTMACLLLTQQRTSPTDAGTSGKARVMPLILSVACFCCALAGGYSRIYLSQHFLLDVCGGAFIGVLVATATYFIFLSKLRK